jgi:DNA-binding transcriptional ArsR family regulator
MVERNDELSLVFGSLSSATRRDMLRRLKRHTMSVGELAAHYNLTFSAISKHLQILEEARLVSKHRNGKEQRVGLLPTGLKTADKHLEQYRTLWENRLDRLEAFLKNKRLK